MNNYGELINVNKVQIQALCSKIFGQASLKTKQWIHDFIELSLAVDRHRIQFSDEAYMQMGRFLYDVAIKCNLPWQDKYDFICSAFRIYSIVRSKHFAPLAPIFRLWFQQILSRMPSNREAFSALYDSVFQMSWQQLDDFETTARALAKEVVRPASDYNAKHFQKYPIRRRSPSDIRIGYLIGNYRISSPSANSRFLHSLFLGHYTTEPKDVHIGVYILGGGDPGDVEALCRLGIPVRLLRAKTVEDTVRSAYAAMEQDGIDVLISELYSAFHIALLDARLACVQLHMTMGFHPLLLHEVDGFLIMEFLREAALASGVPEDRILTFPYALSELYLAPERVKTTITSVRTALVGNRFSVVLGTLCRLEKVTEQFMDVVTKILNAHPEACMVLGGPYEQGRIRSFFSNRGLGDRVFLPGAVDAHVYGRVFDIYLETFPFIQGMSVVEAISKGLPVVHMKCDGDEGYTRQRDPELIAKDEKHYLELIARLIHDAGFATARRTYALQLKRQWSDVESSARAVERHARELLEQRSSIRSNRE